MGFTSQAFNTVIIIILENVKQATGLFAHGPWVVSEIPQQGTTWC